MTFIVKRQPEALLPRDGRRAHLTSPRVDGAALETPQIPSTQLGCELGPRFPHFKGSSPPPHLHPHLHHHPPHPPPVARRHERPGLSGGMRPVRDGGERSQVNLPLQKKKKIALRSRAHAPFRDSLQPIQPSSRRCSCRGQVCPRGRRRGVGVSHLDGRRRRPCTLGGACTRAHRWFRCWRGFGGPAADSTHVRGSLEAAVARSNLRLESRWTRARREFRSRCCDLSFSPSLDELGGGVTD